MNQVTFYRLADFYGKMPVKDYDDLIDSAIGAYEMGMIAIFQRIAAGNIECFKYMTERLIGKVGDAPFTSEELNHLQRVRELNPKDSEQVVVTAKNLSCITAKNKLAIDEADPG